MIAKIKNLTLGTNFTNAIKVALSVAIPTLSFSYFDNFEDGLIIALGVVFTFPSDIPSNLKHKVIGLLVAILIISSVNL